MNRCKLCAIAIAVLAVLSAGGCARNDETTGSLPVACDAYVQLNAAFFSLPEQEGTEAEDRRQAETFAAQAVPLADRVAAGLPSELDPTGDRFTKAIRSVGSEKAFDPVDTDEFFIDSQTIANHLGTNCSFPGGNVEAVDHSFVELPSTVPADRPIALNVTNKGSEAHALSILRARDGKALTVAEVLATPVEEVPQRFELVSAVSVEEPGQQASLITVLAPGTYVIGCFLHDDGKADSPTHASAGMIAAVTAA